MIDMGCVTNPETVLDVAARPVSERLFVAAEDAAIAWTEHTGAEEKLAAVRLTEYTPDELVVAENWNVLHPEIEPDELKHVRPAGPVAPVGPVDPVAPVLPVAPETP